MQHALRTLGRILRRYEIAIGDRVLNIDTVSQLETRDNACNRKPDFHWYEALSYYVIIRHLRMCNLSVNDVVYDVGCGAGRILAILARKKVHRVIGVEIVSSLAEQSRANLSRMRGSRSTWEVLCEDACNVDYSEATVCVLFNPFGTTAMSRFLDRVRMTAQAGGRASSGVKVLYLNPVHDQVLRDAGWIPCRVNRRLLGVRTAASLWTSPWSS